ncbi:MAG: hydrogenase 3 maturation endopeptidase HyCI [Candidatus Omnitrophica bacterium]|nr:hydrogenase 3 maturation endopeptidase HyCI [Candidatus Omnitrophota bacterium]
MQKLKATLKKHLRSAKKTVFLGVGSDLRADDAAGLIVTGNLSRLFKNNPCFKSIFGSTSPENLTGEIKQFCPTHVLIIDSADLGKKAGYAEVVDLDNIHGTNLGTHRMSLKVMADYLTACLGCKVILLCIQPKTVAFGLKPSQEIKKSAQLLAKLIKDVFSA